MEAAGQPGFSKLSPIHKMRDGTPAVAALDLAVASDKPDAAAIRDAEADRVAELGLLLDANGDSNTHLPAATKASLLPE